MTIKFQIFDKHLVSVEKLCKAAPSAGIDSFPLIFLLSIVFQILDQFVSLNVMAGPSVKTKERVNLTNTDKQIFWNILRNCDDGKVCF